MTAPSRPAPGAPPPFRPRPPIVLGLLGGVAAGKSAVGALFAARGLRQVDADAIAREVADAPEVIAAVRDTFGAAAITSAGRLDRAELGRRVFGDPAARQRLEGILHPRILARIRLELAEARAADQSVLLDAPLLLETGLDALCDHLVFVAAPPAVRAERAAARGWPYDELARREAAQRSLADKQARAAWTIDNGGDLAATVRQVDAVLAGLAGLGPG